MTESRDKKVLEFVLGIWATGIGFRLTFDFLMYDTVTYKGYLFDSVPLLLLGGAVLVLSLQDLIQELREINTPGGDSHEKTR